MQFPICLIMRWWMGLRLPFGHTTLFYNVCVLWFGEEETGQSNKPEAAYDSIIVFVQTNLLTGIRVRGVYSGGVPIAPPVLNALYNKSFSVV